MSKIRYDGTWELIKLSLGSLALMSALTVIMGISGCGDIGYKNQTTTGANSTIENFDPDGSVVVTASDQADVNANQGSDTVDTNNEEIGGIPLDSVQNVSGASVSSDPCKDADGNLSSGETCIARDVGK